MILRWIVLLMFLFSYLANAQVKNKTSVKQVKIAVRNLTVGSKVVDIKIEKIINDTRKSAWIHDYKDQLLILDFWATTCSGCVAALPRHDRLQQEFGNRIKILPVTYEASALVSSFLKTNKHTKNLNISSVVEDKTLFAWFKHRSIPHEVWIYKGKVIAITDLGYVDERNIQTVLEGKEINWPVKNDFAYYDYDSPIFQHKENKINAIASERKTSYSGVTGYQEGALPKSGLIIDSINHTQRFYIINHSILNAYLRIWQPINNVLNPFPNQVKLEVKDKSRYIMPHYDYFAAWTRRNDISYEIQWPDTLSEIQRARVAAKDLDRLLELHGRWESRKVKCLILVSTGDISKIKAISGERAFDVESVPKKLRNSFLSNIVYHMNQFPENPFVFDEANYKGAVDLDLNFGSWTDISAIRKALQPYGLNLKEEEREVSFFIITENN